MLKGWSKENNICNAEAYANQITKRHIFQTSIPTIKTASPPPPMKLRDDLLNNNLTCTYKFNSNMQELFKTRN